MAAESTTVLLVEDHPDSLDMLTQVFEARGFIVLAARSVDEALAQLATTTPDAVVTDLQLRGRSTGLELLAALRSREGCAAIPILAVSGSLNRASEEKLRHVGFTALLLKPVDPFEIVTLVLRSLGREA